jgi:NAD(P)H-hydrate epimerase
MAKLVSVGEMQAVEREANASGLTYEIMMENAGRGLAEVVHSSYSHINAKNALGLVGSGNNGGDTLVALAYLAEWGWKVTAYLVRPRPAKDPLVKRLIGNGGEVVKADDDTGFKNLKDLLRDSSVLLDGVLGTGAKLPLKPEVARPMSAARDFLVELSGLHHVVAVDCPSGVDCDTGATPKECLPAEMTITMAAIKKGLVTLPAFQFAGKIQVVGIGPIDDLPAWKSIQRIVTDEELIRNALPPRPPDAHKGTFGTALVVAGSVNYTGAALLAGQAAYRVGAGLVTLCVPATLHTVLAGQFPEATWLLMPSEMGVIAEEAAQVLREDLSRATALLVGPGFGLEDTTKKFIERLFGVDLQTRRGGIGFVPGFRKKAETDEAGLPPLVMDADGLKLLARIPNWHQVIPQKSILTPHPGEMSILTGLEKTEIQADRLSIAERFASEWGQVVVLKGAFTIIAAPDRRTALVPVATPALARAGTGDVLAGIIVGLLAQGVESFNAAAAGAWIHSQAGLKAAEQIGGSASVLAGDVLRAIPFVMAGI